MQSHHLPHSKGRIHYLQFGSGPELLIALHGFGDRARIFAVLESALATHYTVVAPTGLFMGRPNGTKTLFPKPICSKSWKNGGVNTLGAF